MEKAYQSLLKDRKAKQLVVVAVIDSGIDTTLEDLTNPLEKPEEVSGTVSTTTKVAM
ncbi:MAG: hypothetical protein MZU84_02910 [Sphingobacterium sp.]|nr:hypothetical protein [Sphingobacterium sp.]